MSHQKSLITYLKLQLEKILYPDMHNFVVDNQFVKGDESEVFFHGEDVEYIREDADLPQVLFLSEVFPSRSQAKKNLGPWLDKLNWENKELPDGFIQFRAGKKNELVTVLKPTKANLQ